MATKKVIQIDEDKCVGCGKCANSCPGGALQMVNGKAKLVREDFCDGLGVCIGECPVDAITFIDKEVTAPATNQTAHAAPAAQAAPTGAPAPAAHAAAGCPGKANKVFAPADKPASGASALNAWPIQLHLIRPEAQQFQGADILIAASCTAFSCGNFHANLLAGKSLVIACPKLDNLDGYAQKLHEIFTIAKPKSITVARMEVPCCSGLTKMVASAKASAESNIPVQEITISLQGEILSANLI